jgi:hypothetical protein
VCSRGEKGGCDDKDDLPGDFFYEYAASFPFGVKSLDDGVM